MPLLPLLLPGFFLPSYTGSGHVHNTERRILLPVASLRSARVLIHSFPNNQPALSNWAPPSAERLSLPSLAPGERAELEPFPMGVHVVVPSFPSISLLSLSFSTLIGPGRIKRSAERFPLARQPMCPTGALDLSTAAVLVERERGSD